MTHSSTPKIQDLVSVHTLKGHSSAITSVAFSPNGQIIASGSKDKTIKLWNLARKEPHRLSGHGASTKRTRSIRLVWRRYFRCFSS